MCVALLFFYVVFILDKIFEMLCEPSTIYTDLSVLVEGKVTGKSVNYANLKTVNIYHLNQQKCHV